MEKALGLGDPPTWSALPTSSLWLTPDLSREPWLRAGSCIFLALPVSPRGEPEPGTWKAPPDGRDKAGALQEEGGVWGEGESADGL